MRLRALPLLVYLTFVYLSGCALTLRAPDPDVVERRPVSPATETSHLAAVARLPHATLSGLIEQQWSQPTAVKGQLGLVAWQMAVQREGKVLAFADPDGRLCFQVPLAGQLRLQGLGQQLQHRAAAQIRACAKPRLADAGTLRLHEPAARLLFERHAVGGPVQMALDAATPMLQDVVSQRLQDYLTTLTIPTTEAVRPLTQALARPVPLPQNGCLKLRAQSVRVAQPEVDPTALRLAVSVAALPTVEQPCVPETSGRPQIPLPIVLAADLSHPQTFLLLPVGVSLASLEPQVRAELKKLGRVETAQGWVQVEDVRLVSARGVLIARVQVTGQVRDKFLFVPIERPVKGEISVWGVPVVDEKSVHLQDVAVDVQTDDRLVGLAAALQRSALTQLVARHLTLPRERLESQARQALADLGKGFEVGGQRWPVRVDVEKLQLEDVVAAGQRLTVLVRFVGQVVVGETARK